LLVVLALLLATAHSTAADFKQRPLDLEFLQRKAVAYSGYRGASHDTPPTEAEVLEDLELLVQQHFGLIRMFSTKDADGVLPVIRAHRLNLKVQLGLWIAGSKASADAANQREIARGIALAKAYRDLVLAVSVGNETLVDWSMHLPPADIAGYLQRVRSAVEQPVTTDDNWAVFADAGGKYPEVGRVLREIDFVSMHTYPLLDSVYDPAFRQWQHPEVPEERHAEAMMDSFFDKARADYAAVRRYLDAHGHRELPVTIGETGWKAFGPQTDRIGPALQRLYAQRLARWRDGPVQIVWFEAFDEPWKGDDDGWGLFDVHRRPRPVLLP
jgi:exo-beta-1,3-glucanase (GH17 family)